MILSIIDRFIYLYHAILRDAIIKREKCQAWRGSFLMPGNADNFRYECDNNITGTRRDREHSAAAAAAQY